MSDDLAKKLAAASNEMNAALDRAEEVLRALHLGVRADVDLSDGLKLAFCKVDSGWMLILVGVTGEFTRLTNAPRHRRREAAYKLNELYAALHTTAAYELAEVEDARGRLNAFVATRRTGAAAAAAAAASKPPPK